MGIRLNKRPGDKDEGGRIGEKAPIEVSGRTPHTRSSAVQGKPSQLPCDCAAYAPTVEKFGCSGFTLLELSIQLNRDAGERSGRSRTDNAKNKELHTVDEILKKALAYFVLAELVGGQTMRRFICRDRGALPRYYQ